MVNIPLGAETKPLDPKSAYSILLDGSLMYAMPEAMGVVLLGCKCK